MAVTRKQPPRQKAYMCHFLCNVFLEMILNKILLGGGGWVGAGGVGEGVNSRPKVYVFCNICRLSADRQY